jgi:hypothetical protein
MPELFSLAEAVEERSKKSEIQRKRDIMREIEGAVLKKQSLEGGK